MEDEQQPRRSRRERTTEPNEPTDPNESKKKAVPDEVDKAVRRATARARREAQQWAREASRGTLSLAETVYRQVETELTAIRDFAVEENAQKTIMAIDLILDDRNARLDDIADRIEADARRGSQRYRGRPRRGERGDYYERDRRSYRNNRY
jgi:hypothetical protein